MLPWQNLCFWRERSLLDPALAEDALIVPCKGILKICAMSLPDLWSRNSLKDVEGFDHSSGSETLGACGNLPEMQQGPCLPLYFYGNVVRSRSLVGCTSSWILTSQTPSILVWVN